MRNEEAHPPLPYLPSSYLILTRVEVNLKSNVIITVIIIIIVEIASCQGMIRKSFLSLKFEVFYLRSEYKKMEKYMTFTNGGQVSVFPQIG